MGKKIAIVGSGCSGLAALWALKSTDHDIHLFEAESVLGGHTNTVSFKGPDGHDVNVDVGFIVMNTATYRKLNHACFCSIAHENSKFHCISKSSWYKTQKDENDL